MSSGSVVLDRATLRRLANYAKCTGQTVSAVANEAFNQWMDTMGDAVLEEMAKAEVVHFPQKCVKVT